jgi:hypothetical protein
VQGSSKCSSKDYSVTKGYHLINKHNTYYQRCNITTQNLAPRDKKNKRTEKIEAIEKTIQYQSKGLRICRFGMGRTKVISEHIANLFAAD